MKQDLSDKRKNYTQNWIEFSDVPENPLTLFKDWYDATVASGKVEEPNALSLSTIGQDGFPRARIVLLKEFSQEGYVFYTNYSSQKGNAIAISPKVCLSFFWPGREQQIIIKGNASKVPADISDEYFWKRPFESQIGAMVSAQSTVIDLNENLEKTAKELAEKFKEKEIPRPENWGGYLVKPIEFEFWQGRPSRLHDRLRYRWKDGNWLIERLAP